MEFLFLPAKVTLTGSHFQSDSKESPESPCFSLKQGRRAWRTSDTWATPSPMAIGTVLVLWLGLWESNHCKTHSTVSYLQSLHVCTACPPEPIAFLVLPFALCWWLGFTSISLQHSHPTSGGHIPPTGLCGAFLQGNAIPSTAFQTVVHSHVRAWQHAMFSSLLLFILKWP